MANTAFDPQPNTETVSSNAGDPGRLQAFSDGVFGVAITLLVLNIQVPHLADVQASTLARELLRQWPVYLSYVISFFTIGIVWANHHNTFQVIVKADHSLRMLNLFLLMTVTLIPFTTALLSEYIQDTAEQQTAALVYSLGWVLLAIAYNILWQYAIRRHFIAESLTAAQIRTISRRTFFGFICYMVAVVSALFSAGLSIAICMALVVFYLIPAEALPGA